MNRAGQKGVIPFDVTGMELKKSVWQGHPVREVKQFVEVANEWNKPYHVAILECGHGVRCPKSILTPRGDRKRHGVTCYLCPKIEKPKPVPKPEPVPAKAEPSEAMAKKVLEQVIKQNDLLTGMMRQLTDLKGRVEAVEDAATRPAEVSSTNTPEPGTPSDS